MSKTTRRMNRHGKGERTLNKGDLACMCYLGNSRYYSKYNGEPFSNYRTIEVVHMEGIHWKRYCAEFHSEGYFTMNGSPKWYRQSLNRKLRRKQNEVVTKALRDDTFEEMTLPYQKKDAAWYW